MTISEISIAMEIQHKGHWLKIDIPNSVEDNIKAILLNNSGDVLKQITLQKGLNAIDISQINLPNINVKIENAFETILKNIQL